MEDFNEMESALYKQSNSGLNILALFDRTSGYDSSNNDWTGTRLYYVNPDNDLIKINSTLLKDYGELDMGNPSTLNNFITYAKQNFTYQHLMLILWNHGGGARVKSFSLTTSSNIEKDVCLDDTSSGSCLYLDELQTVLASQFSSSNKLDILGFDACLMATVEVAYEFRNLASYMVASMHTEQGDGWDYESLFYGGTSNCPLLDPNSITAEQLAIRAVKSYHDFIENTLTKSAETMSAVDLSKIEDIKTACWNLASHLDDDPVYKTIYESILDDEAAVHFWQDLKDSLSFPYIDLYNFMDAVVAYYSSYSDIVTYAKAVQTAMESAILYAYSDDGYSGETYYFGDGASVGRGLSIFVTRGHELYNGDSAYANQWWYTSIETNEWWTGGHYYGLIDFAYSDADNNVETWCELFEYWYDPTNQYTPSSY
ncbi:MAG TPA: clostripain-related cysteine peptidase [Exilispira sp.]|nr:clostripain-related cysteine peptidase [Exilispira sp.]